jgi:2-methylcitrate dehydratase PrpD
MLKYTPYGYLSQQGVLAAQLAGKGFTGDPGILDGDLGFWRLVGASACDWDILLGDLGSRWWILDASFKPYASGRYGNFPIDLFRRLIEEHQLRADEIDRVDVWTISHAVAPWFNNPPQSQIDLPFNIPFELAACAYRIDLGPRWQSWETVRDARLPAFTQRVYVHPNTELRTTTGETPQLPGTGGLPTRIPTKVQVEARGHTVSATTDYAWGDPWTPESTMTDDQLRDKFRTFCSGVLRSRRIEEALDVLFDLDRVDDIGGQLTPLLR